MQEQSKDKAAGMVLLLLNLQKKQHKMDTF